VAGIGLGDSFSDPVCLLLVGIVRTAYIEFGLDHPALKQSLGREITGSLSDALHRALLSRYWASAGMRSPHHVMILFKFVRLKSCQHSLTRSFPGLQSISTAVAATESVHK